MFGKIFFVLLLHVSRIGCGGLHDGVPSVLRCTVQAEPSALDARHSLGRYLHIKTHNIHEAVVCAPAPESVENDRCV